MQSNRSTRGATRGRRKRSHKLRCVQCGKKFRPSSPKQRFCSRRCYQANYVARNLEKTRAYKKAWNEANRPRKQPELKVCALARCGKKFESSIPWQRFCSEKCRDADHYARHRARYDAYSRKYRAEHPEWAKQALRRYYRKHRAAQNAYSRRRYAEGVAERARLKNVEGLDLKTGLRCSLAAHWTLPFEGKSQYVQAQVIAPLLYSDSTDPVDAAKKFLGRWDEPVIKDERQRVAKLDADQRQMELKQLEVRLKAEQAKPLKKAS